MDGDNERTITDKLIQKKIQNSSYQQSIAFHNKKLESLKDLKPNLRCIQRNSD